MDEELIEDLTRQIYQTRAQSPVEYTDERWANIKRISRTSVRMCRQEAIRMIEDGEMDE